MFNEKFDFDKEIDDNISRQIENLEETYAKDDKIKELDKIEDTYDELYDEFDDLDDTVAKETGFLRGSSEDYTETDIKQLMDEDTLEISYGITEEEVKIKEHPEQGIDAYENTTREKGLSAEGNGMRNSYWVDQDGIHHSDWKNDAVEGTEQEIRIDIGTLLERHTFKGVEEDLGSYMALYGTKIEDKQLNYLEDAYDKNIYIVNEPFYATQSEVGEQGWNNADKALQYKINDVTVQDLLDSGILAKISQEEAEKMRNQ